MLHKQLEQARQKEFSGQTVTLFIESQFVVLIGEWIWDLQSETVFCSEVILSFPFEYAGTKAIIHPEDKTDLQQKIFTGHSFEKINFRVITTYGEIKTLSGQHISVKHDTDTLLSWQEEIMRKVEEERDLPHLQLLTQIYQYTEKDLHAGAWYHNKSTNETWYSSQVFRLFDLPPHSLNENLNTFNSFIHPEEKDIVTEYFHHAYKKQSPFQVEFRIYTAKTEKKLRLVIHWVYSPSGEVICCGTYFDISEQNALEEKAGKNQAGADFFRQLILLDEQYAGLGHWDINLATRKIKYSDNLYRIFGLKPNSIAPGLDAFLNFIHPDDREKYELASHAMVNKHQVPDMAFRIIRPDNKTRFLEQHAKLVQIGGDHLMCGIIRDVTIQKLLEKKIVALVENYSVQKLLQKQSEEFSLSGSWTWNLQTGKIEWSDGFFTLLGIKPASKDLSVKQLLVYVHAEDQRIFADSLELITKEKKDTEFNFRMVLRGQERYMKAIFRIWSEGDKELFTGTIHDLSRNFNLQKQLNEKLQVTETLSENLEDKVIVTNHDNLVVIWNRQCELSYNIKKEQAIGRNIFELLPTLQTAEMLTFYERVFKGETIHVNEYKLFPTGHYHLKLVPLLKEANSEVSGIIHLFHDISREYELKKNLNERLSFIENIVESSVDQIIAFDKNLNFVIWNKQCVKHYGLEKDSVVGKNILDIFPSSKNMPAFEDFRRALRGEKIYIPPQPDLGKENYNEVYLLPVKNEKEEIIAVLWILHDLSNEYDLNAQMLKVNTILESLNECYFELDREQHFIKVNKITEEFWKISREELIGRKFTDVFPHASREILDAMDQSLKTGEPQRGEYYSLISAGWIYLSITPTEDGVAVVFFDLQKIKDAEKMVQESEYLLQQINKATPDAITIYNLEEKQLDYLNNRLAEWTGISSDKLRDMGQEGRLELIHPDDRKSLLAFNETLRTARDKEINTIDYRIINKEQTIWIRNRSKVFKRSPSGAPSHFLTILQDITKEKGLVKQLEERSQYAEAIINSSVDQIIVLDQSLNIIAINQRSEAIFNVKKEDVIGKNLFSLFPKLKEEPIIKNAFEDALSGKFVRLAPRKAIYSDGISERFYIPLKNDHGKIYAIVNIVHDVTEMVQKNEELKDLNNTLALKNYELKQKNEEITNFSFVASHDLKEPLRKIHTFSDWLLVNEASNLTTSGKDYLNRLQGSVQRMERLIDDILVLMKINSDKHRVHNIDLSEILKEVIKDLEETYKDFKVFYDGLPVIKANRNQVFLLFRNLLQNAIKFRKADSIASIRISSAVILASEAGFPGEGGRKFLKISFEDDSKGIHEKHFQKVFKVFQHLHGKDHYVGTGMGLAICKKIMENHEGSISLESVEGRGSVFHCYFPLEN